MASSKSAARTARITASVQWVRWSRIATAHPFTKSFSGSNDATSQSKSILFAVCKALLYCAGAISPSSLMVGPFGKYVVHLSDLVHSRRQILSLSFAQSVSSPRRRFFPKEAHSSKGPHFTFCRPGCCLSNGRSNRAKVRATAAIMHDPLPGTGIVCQWTSTVKVLSPKLTAHPLPVSITPPDLLLVFNGPLFAQSSATASTQPKPLSSRAAWAIACPCLASEPAFAAAS